MDTPFGGGVNATSRRNLYADYQGSIVAVTDSGATVQGVNAYDAYGIPHGNNLGRFSYAGQIYLPEIGLQYYKARMYSPVLKVSADGPDWVQGSNESLCVCRK